MASLGYSCLLPLLIWVSLLAVATAETRTNGKLVEWDFDLFTAANADDNINADGGDDNKHRRKHPVIVPSPEQAPPPSPETPPSSPPPPPELPKGKCKSFEVLDQPGHSAGYFPIDGTKDGHLFYMYFENRFKDPDAPLVFWTNGGPGCSSLFGLFNENGPYDIQDDMTVCWKENGWDIGHNIMFVEQPINVGFSYSTDLQDKVYDEETVGIDILNFLYAFLDMHPDVKNKDFFLTGESFAGHYLPSIAAAIITGNARQTGTHINLKGVFMVDPWVSPSSHYYTYPLYALQQGLISESTQKKMMTSWSDCDNALRFCSIAVSFIKFFACNGAYAFCQSRLFQPVLFLHPFLNYYDIRRHDCNIPGCYDITQTVEFLNKPNVKKILSAKQKITWENCKTSIRRDMGWDVATDSRSLVADVLHHGIRVSVAAGDQDLICNYIGNEHWMEQMAWDHSQDWKTAKKKPLIIDGEEAGYVRMAGKLSFVKVNQAGHMIPMDQPAIAHQLLTAFTRDKPYPTKTSNPESDFPAT